MIAFTPTAIRFYLFLVALFVGFTPSVLADLGSDNVFVHKIINGENAGYDEFPYFAYFSDCGGTLIAEDIVLTAAHCRNGKPGRKSGIQVTVNAYYQYRIRAEAEERFCTEWIDHPRYDPQNYRNDYALCKLDKPVSIDDTKVRLELNEDDSVPLDGEDLLTIGLGYWTRNEGMPSVLQKVNVPVLTNEECRAIDGYHDVDENMICVAGEVGGKDTCYGDSGSPMVRRRKAKDGAYVDTLVGLNSWGRVDGISCGYSSRGASVFARTSTRLDWIQDTACHLGSRASWCGNNNDSSPRACDGSELAFEAKLPAGVTFGWWKRSDPKVKWWLWNECEKRYANFSRLKRAIVDNEYVYQHTLCLEPDTAEYEWGIQTAIPLEHTLRLDGELLVSGTESTTKSFRVSSNPSNEQSDRNCGATSAPTSSSTVGSTSTSSAIGTSLAPSPSPTAATTGTSTSTSTSVTTMAPSASPSNAPSPTPSASPTALDAPMNYDCTTDDGRDGLLFDLEVQLENDSEGEFGWKLTNKLDDNVGWEGIQKINAGTSSLRFDYSICLPKFQCWTLAIFETGRKGLGDGTYKGRVAGEEVLSGGASSKAEDHEICIGREFCKDAARRFKYKLKKKKRKKKTSCHKISNGSKRNQKKICQGSYGRRTRNKVKQLCLETCGRAGLGSCGFLENYGDGPTQIISSGTLIRIEHHFAYRL